MRKVLGALAVLGVGWLSAAAVRPSVVEFARADAHMRAAIFDYCSPGPSCDAQNGADCSAMPNMMECVFVECRSCKNLGIDYNCPFSPINVCGKGGVLSCDVGPGISFKGKCVWAPALSVCGCFSYSPGFQCTGQSHLCTTG
ncbi:MAG: hypothetical protein K8T90_01680 [Planctomycetes bacterium]|nr:hypothetical protein [Planctomycetota bacterium]